MSDTYDFVVIGSGHNGLTTAAYLAKAGQKVLVLERNDWFGGGVVTKEILAPGFKFDLHSSLHVNIQANPLILRDELQLLAKYGLKYLYPDAVYSTIFDDQTSIITYKDIDRTCESIAKISQRDADAYRRFAEMSKKIVPLVTQSLFVPAPPQGQFFALLDQSAEGQEIFRALQQSKLDICREWFESDKLIIHLLKFASETLTAPEDKGTGFILYTMPGMVYTYPIGIPVGGSGALADALIRCLKSYGCELRDKTEVAKVVVEGGRAVGVRARERVDDPRAERRYRPDPSVVVRCDGGRPRSRCRRSRKASRDRRFRHHAASSCAQGVAEISRRRRRGTRDFGQLHAFDSRAIPARVRQF